ncbi:hypothetical protein [Micromonospora maritima]|uniref:hypothetical protein n=1 Tax=Micromonospora maritima TaxID=986711 RepID=UPI00157D124D|nr:hypothetical protein [Micromonospora maritima]
MTWTGEDVTDPRLCDICGVIVLPAGEDWEHPAELREKFSQTVCDEPEPGRAPKPRELRYGRGRQVSRDKRAIVGRVDGYPVAPGAPIIVACDGSHKFNPAGPPWYPISWGYVAANGQYALGTATQPKSVVGDRAFGSELRAIFWALEQLPNANPASVLTDSRDAVDLIERWRAAGKGAAEEDLPMPPGYTTERASGNEAKMMRLAKQFAEDPDWLTVAWVRAGEHPLHAGADKLAKIARIWAIGEISKEDAEVAAERAARAALTQP